MYWFIGEKSEFTDGRTVKSLSDKTGITASFIYTILNKKRGCTKPFAYAITKAVGKKDVENYFKFIEK